MYSLYLLFVGLIVLAAVLMCFVVLIQNSKGGGLSSSFAASNQIMGVRCCYSLCYSYHKRSFICYYGSGSKRTEN